MDLRDDFLRELSRLRLGRARALIAVSGGADSVALLDLLHQTSPHHQLEPIAAHVDHGINPASGEVARRVVSLASGYGYECVVGALRLGADASETTARTARYAWLRQVRAERGACWILTAHHADDQTETVLMRVLGGSGPSGLAGMSSRRGSLVRPLLPFRRESLVRYLRERGLDWWEDPANRDPRHLRSWLRSVVIPTLTERMPDLAERLNRLRRQARLDRTAWDTLLDSLPALEWRMEPSGSSVAGVVLAGYDTPLAVELLRAMARRSGRVLGSAKAVRALEFLRGAGSGARFELGGGWWLETAFGRLHLFPPRAPQPTSQILEVSGDEGVGKWEEWELRWRRETAPAVHSRDAWTAWFTPQRLAVRGLVGGERVRPLKGAGSRPVVRCFQEKRVPRTERAHWPVVEAGGLVVWIPGVCRSEEFLPPEGSEALRIDAGRR